MKRDSRQLSEVFNGSAPGQPLIHVRDDSHAESAAARLCHNALHHRSGATADDYVVNKAGTRDRGEIVYSAEYVACLFLLTLVYHKTRHDIAEVTVFVQVFPE